MLSNIHNLHINTYIKSNENIKIPRQRQNHPTILTLPDKQTKRSGYLHANALSPMNVTVLRETEEHR